MHDKKYICVEITFPRSSLITKFYRKFFFRNLQLLQVCVCAGVYMCVPEGVFWLEGLSSAPLHVSQHEAV